MTKRVKDVCGAIIRKDGKILVAQRKFGDTFGGLWEFPGGSIEEGESKEEALRREIAEELGIDINVGKEVFVIENDLPNIKIIIYLFECSINKGMPESIDCQDLKWVDMEELNDVKFIPADKKAVEWIIENEEK